MERTYEEEISPFTEKLKSGKSKKCQGNCRKTIFPDKYHQWQHWCKKCRLKRQRKFSKRWREKHPNYWKKWRKSHPGKKVDYIIAKMRREEARKKKSS